MIEVWNKGFFGGLTDVIKATNIKGQDEGSVQNALRRRMFNRIDKYSLGCGVCFSTVIKAPVTKRWF